jgi:hypothetical protein
VVFDDDSVITHWSEDCQSDRCIGIYEWHDELLYPSSVEMAKEWDRILSLTVGEVMKAEAQTPLSSLIFFWTSVAAIAPFAYAGNDDKRYEAASRQCKTIMKGTEVIRQVENGVLFDGVLTPKELKSVSWYLQAGKVELVYIGHSSISSGKWCLILISWEGGIARRILPQVLFHITASNWEIVSPMRKLVVLG